MVGDRGESPAVGAVPPACSEFGRELSVLVVEGLEAFLEGGDAFAKALGGQRAVLEGFVVAVECAIGLGDFLLNGAVVCFELGALVLLAFGRFGYRGLEQLSVAVQAH